MKSLGFLASLALHLLFLLLVVTLRFPVPDSVIPARIIQVVPMSPPETSLRQAAPPLVYVRPFVMIGGPPGGQPGTVSGKGGGDRPEERRSPRRGTPAAQEGQPPSFAGPGRGKAEEEASEGDPGSPEPPGLNVDEMNRIARRVRGKGVPATILAAGQKGMSLPFDSSPGAGHDYAGSGMGGDGTASHALGGNAFFDSRGYDITPWAQRMVYRVKRNWILPPVSGYGLKGSVGIFVLIERDGSIGRIFIRKASGIRPFDQAAFNAIEMSVPLPPLPDDFPYDDLPAYLVFLYN